MKRFLFVLLLLVGIIFFLGHVIKERVRQDIARPIPYPTPSLAPAEPTKDVSLVHETNSLFVPDWTLSENAIDASDYKSVIYFGITPSKDGIDMKESGAAHLDSFLAIVPPDTKKLLTVRMTETTTNLAILKDKELQKKLIAQSLSVANDNGFSGVVLDLEIAAIPFDSLTNQINDFTKSFYQEAKKQHLSLALTIYGDTFYRLRPFDVKQLAKNADEIMVMSYDFHKARGNPGPNFPLRGNDLYGYDLTRMADDFLQAVPANKITVVFGLYGYDWAVNSSGNASGQAKPVTTNEVTKQFVTGCSYKNCSVDRDDTSGEVEIHYTDTAGSRHTLWAEDMESVARKKEYLKERGISHFSYWAYSYF